MIPPTRLVTSPAGTLAVREWRDGAGTPLVFSHALGPCVSGAELVELPPRLAAHGKVFGSPAEAMRLARGGLLDRLSPRWPGLAGVPILLFLATQPPHVDQNREHLPHFQAAVPHADVRWPDGAGHGVIADVGPPLGDEIAAWVTAQSGT